MKKVRKDKFDAVLCSMLKQNPAPRGEIKTKGKRGPKTPILKKP